MTRTTQLRFRFRTIHHVRDARSGAADRESTITSKGGLDNGDPKVALSQG